MSESWSMEKAFRSYLEFIVARPRAVFVVFGLLVLLFGSFLPRIRFDNRPDSFIPERHPSLLAKQEVERRFGLEDPILIAVLTGRPDGIFEAASLRLIDELSRRVSEYLETTYPDRNVAHPVYSIATEYDVELVDGVIFESSFLDPFPQRPEDFDRLRDAVFRIELYTGVIVSEDGSAGAVVIVPPPGEAQAVNRFLQDLVAPLREQHREAGIDIVLAGEAAVRSSMGEAVTLDALRLNPFCMVVVTLFLFLAFRTAVGVLLPLLVVGFGCVVMLGAMFFCDIPVYIITNAILITVMAIGVADAIHVQSEYYDEIREGTFRDRRDLVVRSILRLRVPILCTSLTDTVGFLSFLLSGAMPPFQWFGVFTAVGICATMIASFSLLPAGLVLLDPAGRRHQRRKDWAVSGVLAVFLGRLGVAIARRPRLTVILFVVLLLLAGIASLGLRVDQSMVSTFDEDSDVVVADRLVNEVFDGTYFLDVLLEKQGEGDLLEPEILRRIEALETFAQTLPRVSGSTSVTGFARKLNQILNDWGEAEKKIPTAAGVTREHFTLLDTSPTKKADLLRLIDSDYRVANVRLRLSSGWFSDEKVVVEAMQDYLREHFPPAGAGAGVVKASLAGRVNMDYHWVRLIVRGHVASVLCTLVIIFMLIAIQFRSIVASLLCLFSVGTAVLTTYAAMALLGIELSIGTSMFASLTIGVGVNFPLHMLHRLQLAGLGAGRSGEAKRSEDAEAFRRVFSLTGKALCFNALAVCFGFLVLTASGLPLLRHFGLMIALGIGTACIGSLIFLPALAAWLRPRFLYPPSGE